MLVQLLKSKIHRARVTEANLAYEGSLTLDRDLIERAGLFVHEKIAVWNVSNGHRFETYVIEGERGSGVVCVNGAAAHLAREGDILIIASYAMMEPHGAGWEGFRPRIVRVDERNRPLPDSSLEHAR